MLASQHASHYTLACSCLFRIVRKLVSSRQSRHSDSLARQAQQPILRNTIVVAVAIAVAVAVAVHQNILQFSLVNAVNVPFQQQPQELPVC